MLKNYEIYVSIIKVELFCQLLFCAAAMQNIIQLGSGGAQNDMAWLAFMACNAGLVILSCIGSRKGVSACKLQYSEIGLLIILSARMGEAITILH